MKWEKNGFSDFSKGKLGNSGQNIYVSANGVLQRIHNYDINGDGYPDLVFANSQSMNENPPIHLYSYPYSSSEFKSLPSGGSYDGVMSDLNGDGYEDLVIACQNNGAHNDVTAIIYYGSKQGLTEKYKIELPVPDSTGVTVGDFNGDGKLDLAFLCNNQIRIFLQSESGFLPSKFMDIPIEGVSLCSGYIDEDRYSDLYVKLTNGKLAVLWGSEEGLSLQRISWISENHINFSEYESINQTFSTTSNRRPAYHEWRTNIVTWNDVTYLFAVRGEEITFYICCEDRRFEKIYSFHCPGAVAISVGDLDGDGYSDLVVAVCKNKDIIEKSIVYWGNEIGFSANRISLFETISARNVYITDLGSNGKNSLIVCQGRTSSSYSSESKILQYNSSRDCHILAILQSGDAMTILAGKTGDSQNKQISVINHETGKVRGDENVFIYLGSPGGYHPDHKIELPGWAAVHANLYDFNDDGYVDILIANCSENAPHLDPGSFLYINGADGFDPKRRIVIPTIRSHGTVIGDFRKCGYLDIISGGVCNRELRIFKGSRDGYDVDHPIKIVLGGGDESYNPTVPENEAQSAQIFSRNDHLITEYGEVRFLFTADFNGDGWLDLFVSEIMGPTCFILWGGPEGFSAERMQILYTGGVASANAADLDGDGYLDIVLSGYMFTGKQNLYESYTTIYWGGNNGFEEHRKTQLPVNCTISTAIGDFNNDGILDIYAPTYHNGRSRDILSFVYYGNSDGIFSVSNHKYLFNHSGSGAISGDFDGDGYTDLVVACHKKYGNHNSTSFIFWGGPDGLSEDRKTILPTVGPHGICTVEPGNIMDRSDEEYYMSEHYAVPTGMTVKSISWEANIPGRTWVQAQIRHAGTELQLESASWQGINGLSTIENGATLTELNLHGGYIQYRLILGAKCAAGTPRVTRVSVEFL